jgi:hypothetical protein
MSDGDHTRYWKFGPLSYARVGEVSEALLFGLTVYARIGSLRSLFGVAWGH